MIAEYLEHALKFEPMAAQEADPKLKASLQTQAIAYRKLAEKRAADLKLPQRARPVETYKNDGPPQLAG